ncbi:hypothetical protein U9R90_13185 [Streptomyces sp. E11-3]|uniref:hypothetical protein n=1 Tax=Streptomyces sp. E11-3 TaxID=3110112 RepID=UPI00397F335C
MTVTWRSAFSYAFVVGVLSWLTGVAVELGLMTLSEGSGGWSASRASDPWELAFPPVAVLSLAVARRLLPPLPRWRVILTDGIGYTVVLLVYAGLVAWAAGDEAPADSAFVTGIIAMLSLQLPAAWLLSAWRSGALAVVVTPMSAAQRARLMAD